MRVVEIDDLEQNGVQNRAAADLDGFSTGLGLVPLTIQEKRPDDWSLDTSSPSYGPNTAPFGMYGSTQRTSTSSPSVKTSRPDGTVSAALLSNPGDAGVSGTKSGGPWDGHSL